MIRKPLMIYFVTWPDGKLFEGTQNSVDQSKSVAKAIRTWLIPEFFPGLELDGIYSYGPLSALWKAMERAGFKVHELEVPADIAKGIAQ